MCVIIDLASYRYNKLKKQGKLNTSKTLEECIESYIDEKVKYKPLKELIEVNKNIESKMKKLQVENNNRVKNSLKKG